MNTQAPPKYLDRIQRQAETTSDARELDRLRRQARREGRQAAKWIANECEPPYIADDNDSLLTAMLAAQKAERIVEAIDAKRLSGEEHAR